MHRALDLRVAAVIPSLLGQVPLDDDPAITLARREASALISEMIDLAHADGTLRSDVEFGDVGLMVVRLSRPLPGSFPPSVESALAHRHLDLVIDGLRAVGNGSGVASESSGLSLGDLQALGRDPRAEGSGLSSANPKR